MRHASAVIASVLIGLNVSIADDFTAIIKKVTVGDTKITIDVIQNIVEKDKVAKKEVTLDVGDTPKVTRAEFNKEKKLVHGPDIPGGLRNPLFEKIEKGIVARFKTFEDKVTEIIILTPMRKGEK